MGKIGNSRFIFHRRDLQYMCMLDSCVFSINVLNWQIARDLNYISRILILKADPVNPVKQEFSRDSRTICACQIISNRAASCNCKLLFALDVGVPMSRAGPNWAP